MPTTRTIGADIRGKIQAAIPGDMSDQEVVAFCAAVADAIQGRIDLERRNLSQPDIRRIRVQISAVGHRWQTVDLDRLDQLVRALGRPAEAVILDWMRVDLPRIGRKPGT